MGADPDAITPPELANPAAAAAIRSEFAEKFGVVAEEYAGTVAAALAQLEQGNLAVAAGETDAAIGFWRDAIDDLSGNPNLQAIFEQRIGHAYEDDARWLEAAESYASAGAVEGYPLRHWALAEAARCLQQAGEIGRARELALKLGYRRPGADAAAAPQRDARRTPADPSGALREHSAPAEKTSASGSSAPLPASADRTLNPHVR